MADTPRILVVRFSSLGDVILTTPLLRALRARHAGAAITYVTKRQYVPVLENNPHVARLLALEPGDGIRTLVDLLRHEAFDARLDLHGSLRSWRLRQALGGSWSRHPGHRVRRWRMLWFGTAAAAPLAPVAERYFAAARALEVEPDGKAAEVFPSGMDQAAAEAIAPQPFVALAPGARHRTKRWPAAHWRALAGLVRERGLQVVALGTSGEQHLLGGPGITSGFGLSLGITAALLARARVVVCNDSGLMHLAGAVGGRVVTLFGPTVPAFGFAPYRTDAVVLERALGCRPCSAAGGPLCPLLHHRCLSGITPRAVADALVAA